MIDDHLIADQYARGDLLGAISEGVEKIGKTPETVTVEDLGSVDEFHIGGRPATRSFLDQMAIEAESHVLDIGCGIGGSSRFAAQTYKCRVSGIDLTEEYIETGNELCRWVGLDDRVELFPGNALRLAFPDATFDRAFMLHVGMNVEEKTILAAEVWRILKPGGLFGIYDIMKTGTDPITLPVPWAAAKEASRLGTPSEYKSTLDSAGFDIVHEQNCRQNAVDFFEDMAVASAASGEPPALGLHLIMGSSTRTKIQNLADNIKNNRVAPFEMISRKATV